MGRRITRTSGRISRYDVQIINPKRSSFTPADILRYVNLNPLFFIFWLKALLSCSEFDALLHLTLQGSEEQRTNRNAPGVFSVYGITRFLQNSKYRPRPEGSRSRHDDIDGLSMLLRFASRGLAPLPHGHRRRCFWLYDCTEVVWDSYIFARPEMQVRSLDIVRMYIHVAAGLACSCC